MQTGTITTGDYYIRKYNITAKQGTFSVIPYNETENN